MKSFKLKILTPAGEAFSGEVNELFIRTTAGEVGILAGHTDYLAGVTPCAAKLTDSEGKEVRAFCGGGFLSVVAGEASIATDEFVFSEQLSAEAVKTERDALANELASCDKAKEAARYEYLKTALTRSEAKCKAVEQ